MNSMYFGDLDTKLSNAETMALHHNRVADQLRELGKYVPRYDLLDIRAGILKAHRKFYGGLSKYNSDGSLR